MEMTTGNLVTRLEAISCSDTFIELKQACLDLYDSLRKLPSNHPLFAASGKSQDYITEELYRAANTNTFKWGIQFVLRLHRTIKDYSRLAVAA